MSNFAQQGATAPWRNDLLGHGGHPGTIGQYGCDVTTDADFCTWAGIPYNPGTLNAAFNAAGIYASEADGTFDLMPGDDNELTRLLPARWAPSVHYAGRNDAAIAAALPTPDTYVKLGLAWVDSAGVHHTHFVPVIGGSGPNWLIGDSWDGAPKYLSAYGVGNVFKTVTQRLLPALPDPAIAAAAAAAAAKAAQDAAAAQAARDAAASAALAQAQAQAQAAADAAAQAAAQTAADTAAQAAANAAAAQAAAAASAAAAAAAQAAHDKQVADAGKAPGPKMPAVDWQTLLVALLRWLVHLEGYGQAAVTKVQPH